MLEGRLGKKRVSKTNPTQAPIFPKDGPASSTPAENVSGFGS